MGDLNANIDFEFLKVKVREEIKKLDKFLRAQATDIPEISLHKLFDRITGHVFFKRLENIYQLGTVHLTIKTATHSRAHHSIDVARLGAKSLLYLAKVHTNEISFECASNILVACLCHDIGHAPFSHEFEHCAKRAGLEFSHEIAGCHLIRKIAEHVPFFNPNFVCQMVMGKPIDIPKFWAKMISNELVDLDRLSYLQLDVKYCQVEPDAVDFDGTPFSTRIKEDKIICGLKIGEDRDLYFAGPDTHDELRKCTQLRGVLHRDVYNTKIQQGLGFLIFEMLRQNMSGFIQQMSDLGDSGVSGLTDVSIQTRLLSKSPELYARLLNKDVPKCVESICQAEKPRDIKKVSLSEQFSLTTAVFHIGAGDMDPLVKFSSVQPVRVPILTEYRLYQIKDATAEDIQNAWSVVHEFLMA